MQRVQNASKENVKVSYVDPRNSFPKMMTASAPPARLSLNKVLRPFQMVRGISSSPSSTL